MNRNYLRHGVASDADQYFCRCSFYPNGNYFHTKRSYDRHLARLQLEDREALNSDNDDIAVEGETDEKEADEKERRPMEKRPTEKKVMEKRGMKRAA